VELNIMDKSVGDQWKRFLTPEILRSNLIIASVYISAYEILKDSIIERIRDFYWTGWNSGTGDIIDPSYESEVLSKNRSPLYASLQWLKEADAISDKDLETFDIVKEYRNNIAHGISKLIINGPPSDLPERFSDMVSLLNKIEKWWIVTVEIPLNEELAGKEIDEEGIIPGPVASIRMMADVALGTNEQAEYYIQEFIKHGLISSSKD
jgi:hypothetical protein